MQVASSAGVHARAARHSRRDRLGVPTTRKDREGAAVSTADGVVAKPQKSAPLTAFSVDRSLHVLNAFMGPRDEMTLTELTQALEMPKSTVFRLLAQLTESGYVERDGRKYRLSLRVFQLGNHHTLCGANALREMAAPHMGGLFQHTGANVSLAVLSGHRVVYLDRIRGPRSGPSPALVGGSLPALTTALGKSILAYERPEVVLPALRDGLVRRTRYSIVARGQMDKQLHEVRSTGIAFDREESVLGLACVAAAIRQADGVPLAAISMSGPAVRFNLATAVPLVKRAAQLISNDAQRAHRLG